MKKNRQNSIVFDELTKKYLKSEIIQSLPDVDLNVENIRVGLEIKGILEVNRVSFATFLVGLATLIVILISK